MSWIDDALVLERVDQLPADWKQDLVTLRAAGEAPPPLPLNDAPPAPPPPTSAAAPAPVPGPENPEPGFFRKAAATGVEVAAPVVGGLVGSVGGPLGTAAGGFAGGVAGRAAGDYILGKTSTPTGLLASGVVGAIPAGAAANVGEGIVKQGIAHALEGSAIGVGSEVVHKGLEEGRLPTVREATTGAVVGAVTGGTIGAAAEAIGGKAEVAPPEPKPDIVAASESVGKTLETTTPGADPVQLGLFDTTGHIRPEVAQVAPAVVEHISGPASQHLASVVADEGAQAAELLASTASNKAGERLYKNVAELYIKGELDAPGLVQYLKDSGRSLPDFIREEYVPSIRLAAQQLNQLSSLRKQLNRMADQFSDKDAAAALDELSNAPAGVRFTEFLQRLEDTRRTLLISQLKTGVRNAASQSVAYGTDILEQGMRQAVGGEGDFFGSIASLGRAWNKDESRAMIERLLTGRQDLLEKLGEHEFRPPNTFLETNGVLKATLGRFVNITTYINQAQEAFFRRATFDSTLRSGLRKAGIDIEEALANPKLIPPELLDKSVDRALELTFAQTAPGGEGGMVEKFVNGFQTARPITTFITPFPRYMGNAFVYVMKRNPLGLVRLATAGGRANWDKVASEAMVGTMLFSGALALRHSSAAGEHWYEVKNGDKRYDLRGVAGPFAPYLFAAEATRQYLDTGHVNFNGGDVVEGLLSMNRLAGTLSPLLSWLKGDVSSPENWQKGIEGEIGQWVGGFSTPARNIKDALTIAGQEQEGIYRDQREFPLTGPTRANIPGLDRTMPEQPGLTTGDAMKTESPVLTGLIGLNSRTTNGLDQEIARLNISLGDLAPKTGFPKADRELSRRVGKIVAVAGPRLVAAPKYQALGPAMRERMLHELFHEARQAAMEHLQQTNPKVWAVIKAKGELTPDIRAALSDRGIDAHAKLQAILDSAPEGPVSMSIAGQRASKPAPASTPAAPPAPAARVVQDGKVTDDAIADVATLAGLQPNLLRAVVATESSGRPEAKGPITKDSGGQHALGVTQILPTTFAEVAPQIASITGRPADIHNPFDNLLGGALLYRRLLQQTGGDVAAAARLYHGGPNLAIHGPKTRDYGRKVQTRYEALNQGG